MLKLEQAGIFTPENGKLEPSETITAQYAVDIICRALGMDNRDSVEFGLNDNGSVTRAETLSVLDELVSGYYTEAGTYTVSGKGCVIVKANGVTISNSKIAGNLIITGGGSVPTLTNSEVLGKTITFSELPGKTGFKSEKIYTTAQNGFDGWSIKDNFGNYMYLLSGTRHTAPRMAISPT